MLFDTYLHAPEAPRSKKGACSTHRHVRGPAEAKRMQASSHRGLIWHFPFALALMTLICGSTAEAQQFRDWTLERDDATCVVSTRVHLRSTDTLLVAVSLSRVEGDGVLMAVEVPVGASLRDDIAYVHMPGGRAQPFDWQFCNAQTCLATATIAPEELGALKVGTRITVAFRPLPQSQVLATPVSLMGLTRAWEALESCNAAQP